MAFLIDQLNNSGLFAQSAYSASIATYDSDGNIITATYLSSHQPISANEWNSSYETVQNNSATWNTVTDKLDSTAYTPFDPTYISGVIDNKLDTTAFSDVSGTFLTAHQSLDGYATTAWVDSQGYLTAHQPISADEWNDVYNTVNINSGAWTGSESSPTASVDSNGSIDIVSSNNTVYFDVNGTWFNDAVNSAVDVPTGVMVESACEYNAVNEISGYNGSAIAQYGAEKQWLVHDDTLVHISNSAQYAFGCNISALQRLMGIDETVLYSGAATTSCVLTESPSAFDRVRFYGYRNEGSIANSRGVFEFPTEGMTGYDLSQLLYNNEDTYRALYLSRYAITGTNCTLEKAQHLYTPTANKAWDGPGTCAIVIYKIVGVHRISG